MANQITGRIIEIGQTVQIPSKNGGSSFTKREFILDAVLRNKWTPLQIVITNGYTCSIFQVAKITRKTEITTNNTESLTHLLFIILKLNIINRKFCKYCIYFISSIV